MSKAKKSKGTPKGKAKVESKCQNCLKPCDGDEHGCPYAEDINGDYERKCNCCPDCMHECVMDI